MLSVCYLCSRQFNEARDWLATALNECAPSAPAWWITQLERLGSLVDVTERWIADQDPETSEPISALPRPWLLCVDCEEARLLDPSGLDLLNDGFLSGDEPQMTRTSSLYTNASAASQTHTNTNDISDLPQAPARNIPEAAHVLGDLQDTLKKGDWEYVLAQLPATLKARISHSAPLQGPHCWTYTQDPTSSAKTVPLTIAGAPVVIPVRYRYPLLAPTGTPPDPYRPFIDPAAPLSDHMMKEIFRTYKGAKGFYLLLNGMLQLLVPKGFDYAQALATKPIKFGGLDVSYIPMSVVPTASSTKTAHDTLVTTVVTEHNSRRSRLRFLSHSWETISHSLRFRHAPQTTMPPGGLQINSVLEARAHGRRGPLGWTLNSHGEPERPSGRLGLHISTSNRSREFLTMSTHVLHRAFFNSKRQAVPSLSSSFSHVLGSPADSQAEHATWTDQVEVYAGDRRIGKVAKSYDPSAGHGDFPEDYIHDLSLIEPLNRSIVKDIHSPEPNLGWLTGEGWQNLRRSGGPLKMLGLGEDKPAAIHLPVHESSEFQIVGVGMVANADPYNELIPRQRDLKSHATAQAMARCILYRVWPALSNPFAFSGMALYTIGPREPVNGQDIGVGAAVVGFQSFY